MRVRVVYYGVLKEDVGTREQILELSSTKPTVDDLIAQLEETHPELARRTDSIAFAVDNEIVDRDYALHDGAKIDLLPPVSGGCERHSDGTATSE